MDDAFNLSYIYRVAHISKMGGGAAIGGGNCAPYDIDEGAVGDVKYCV